MIYIKNFSKNFFHFIMKPRRARVKKKSRKIYKKKKQKGGFLDYIINKALDKKYKPAGKPRGFGNRDT